jgi:hypothetical protein
VTLDASTQPEVHLGRLVTLKEIGLGEHWLQDWLVKDPSRLGLGTLEVVDQEQMQSGGGVLDILATSGDVYYSIEVQLGEVDASHGFRVLTTGPGTVESSPARPTLRCWLQRVRPGVTAWHLRPSPSSHHFW